MQSIPLLILFGFFVVIIHSRPSQTDANSDSVCEETDYIEVKADDTPERELRIESESGVGQIGAGDLSKNAYSYEQGNVAVNRPDRTNPDISDLKVYNRNLRSKANYIDTKNYNPQRQAKYVENKEPSEPETGQRVANRNANFPKIKRYHNNMLLDDSLAKMENGLKKDYSNVQGIILGSRAQADKGDFMNEPLELNQPYSRYNDQINQEPLNPEPSQGNKNREDRNYLSRDRRDATDPSPDIVNIEAEKDVDNESIEDEEAAIKRHIKKMSSDELEELLSSLSDEKKQLLKSIMDENYLSSHINELSKREITKKAGAVEENSCIVSGQVDSNISGESAASESEDKTTESPLQNNANTDISKETEAQPENNVGTSTESSLDEKLDLGVEATQPIADTAPSSVRTEKNVGAMLSTDDKSGAGLVPNDEKSSEVKPNDNESPAQVLPSEIVTSKGENKRETNIDELADVISFDDSKMADNDWLEEDSKEQCACSYDENLSQFTDEDQPTNNDFKKAHKRDVQAQADYDSKLKSLEESFPKSSNYDEVDGPLIRVKRKPESAMKKRAAAILPDSKVSFFPYRAENEDEDNDEGNEFDDDGFYDRTPNFSNDQQSNAEEGSIYKYNDPNVSLKENVGASGPIKETPSNKEATSNLGSDTDGVLSGVEGEDENIMFSTGSRNRRTTDEISDNVDDSNSIHNVKSLTEDEVKAAPNSVVTYEESDSFGPLPRHNNGETGRYKRIRRVKQSHPEQTNMNS